MNRVSFYVYWVSLVAVRSRSMIFRLRFAITYVYHLTDVRNFAILWAEENCENKGHKTKTKLIQNIR